MSATTYHQEQQRKYGFDTGRIERLKEAVEAVAMCNNGTVSLENLRAAL